VSINQGPVPDSASQFMEPSGLIPGAGRGRAHPGSVASGATTPNAAWRLRCLASTFSAASCAWRPDSVWRMTERGGQGRGWSPRLMGEVPHRAAAAILSAEPRATPSSPPRSPSLRLGWHAVALARTSAHTAPRRPRHRRKHRAGEISAAYAVRHAASAASISARPFVSSTIVSPPFRGAAPGSRRAASPAWPPAAGLRACGRADAVTACAPGALCGNWLAGRTRVAGARRKQPALLLSDVM
jgi:hypothetical protein